MDKLYGLASATKLDTEDVRAITAALCFILASAAKYDTSTSSLSSELQQLGLPKGNEVSRDHVIDNLFSTEHSTSLSKVYAERQEDLGAALSGQSFRCKYPKLKSSRLINRILVNRSKDVTCEVKTGLSSKGLQNPDLVFAKLQMNVVEDSGVEKVVNVSLTPQMLDNLIADLNTVEKIMGKMNK